MTCVSCGNFYEGLTVSPPVCDTCAEIFERTYAALGLAGSQLAPAKPLGFVANKSNIFSAQFGEGEPSLYFGYPSAVGGEDPRC